MTTISRRTLLAGGLGLAAAAAPRSAFAAYPERDITYVIPYSPGGMSDNISRVLGEKLGSRTGRRFLNEYRAGAGGAIGANYYMSLRPDGYAILQSTNSFYAVIPNVTRVQYDPKADLTPLVLVGDAPMVIACNPRVPAQSLQELIAHARAHPGRVRYGTAGRGTVGHLSGVWLSSRAGIELLHVPYNGAGEAIQAALSGETQVFFGPEAAEHILGGTLTGLGVMGSARWDALPQIPATVEAGIPGWAPRSWHTVTIHARAPDAIKQSLATWLNEALALPDVTERLRRFGLIPGIEDMAAMRRRADDDYTEFRALLTEAGLVRG